MNRALAELLLTFSRHVLEDSARVLIHQGGDKWLEFFPTQVAVNSLPAEIILPPARFFALEAEMKNLGERLEEIEDKIRLGSLASADADAQAAQLRERLEACDAEMKAQHSQWRQKLCPDQS